MAEVRAIDEVREIDEDRAIESMKVQIKKLWEKWLERLDTKMVPKRKWMETMFIIWQRYLQFAWSGRNWACKRFWACFSILTGRSLRCFEMFR